MASLQTQSHTFTGRFDPAWPSADVVVLPGFPDAASTPQDGHEPAVYPSSATDVVKILRAEGLDVAYAVDRSERRLMSKNAAEHWLPVVVALTEFGANTLTSVLASHIAEFIVSPFERSSKLHVRCGKSTSDGDISYFSASGPPEVVLDALKEFGRQ